MKKWLFSGKTNSIKVFINFILSLQPQDTDEYPDLTL